MVKGNIIERLYLNIMDELPNEIIQTIFDICSSKPTNILSDCDDYSGIISCLMLSMTCKTILSIYNKNSYITTKDIPIKIYGIHFRYKTYEYTINVKICNTLADIVQKVKAYNDLIRDRISSVRIYKSIDGDEKCIICSDGKYITSYLTYENGKITKHDTNTDSNKPIGYMDIWDSITRIAVFYYRV